MASDSNTRLDGAVVELNGEVVHGEHTGQGYDNLPALERPADSAGKAAWVDYAVALGADRTYLEGDTEHTAYDQGGNPEYVTSPGLTKPELVELADRLEG